MADAEEIIRDLENLPNVNVHGYYFLQMPHSTRDDTVELIIQQQTEIDRLKRKTRLKSPEWSDS